MTLAPNVIWSAPTASLRGQQFTIGVAAFLLLVFTVLKASLTEFTPDESATWHVYASHLTLYPEVYDNTAANHHWLNSWLMHFFSMIFGNSPFALRLPNLIAHGFYLFFTARIVLLQQRKTLVNLGLFLILNAHPYLLDFFCVARGYGLAIAAMTAAFFFAYRYINDSRSSKELSWTIVAALLSVLSNFLFLDFMLSLFLLLSLLILFNVNSRKEQKLKHLAMLFTSTILLLALILPHLVKMQQAGALFYGSEKLWDGTVKTLCLQLMYEAPYGGANFFASLKPVIYAMSLFILLSAVLVIRRDGFAKWATTLAGLSSLIFIGTMAILIAQHILSHSLYPFQRTGLFIFILFLFSFLFSFEALPLKKIVMVSSQLFACVVLSHFILRANLAYNLEWKQTAGAAKFIETIENQRKHLMHPPAMESISAGGVSGPALAYIIERENIHWLTVNSVWESKLPSANYYLIEDREHKRNPTAHWQKLDTCLKNGNALYVDEDFLSSNTQVSEATFTYSNTNSAPSKFGGRTRRANRR